MQDVIFYGIGKYYKEKISEWSNTFNAVELCDQYPNKEKNIILLERAKFLHPDVPIFISVTPNTAIFYEIQDYMNELGISKEHIINWADPIENGYYYGWGCEYLEHYIRTFNDRMEFCCHDFGKNRSFVIRYSDNVEKTVDEYIDTRREIIDKLNHGEDNPCSNCIYLKKRYWKRNEHIQALNFGFGAICNLRCIYCKTPNLKISFSNRELEYSVSLLKEFRKRGVIDDNTQVDLASGEISVHPERERILNLIKDMYVHVYSNCVKYEPFIGERLSEGKWMIITSLDAGTAETFSRIKGCKEDLFYKTLDTIERYQARKSHDSVGVQVKYIVLPGINDNIADLKGFVEFCKKAGICETFISRNSHDMNDLPETAVNFIANMVTTLEKENIVVYLPDYVLSTREMDKVQNVIKELRHSGGEL